MILLIAVAFIVVPGALGVAIGFAFLRWQDWRYRKMVEKEEQRLEEKRNRLWNAR